MPTMAPTASDGPADGVSVLLVTPGVDNGATEDDNPGRSDDGDSDDGDSEAVIDVVSEDVKVAVAVEAVLEAARATRSYFDLMSA